MEKKPFYITTAIDYANAAPHIGHALEKVQADTLARSRRARGNGVFFLTGTDEHGAKNVRAAESAGKNPQLLVDENAAKFRALKEALNLSWDDFIRTTDQKRHWPGAQKLWTKLHDGGALYKKNYRGLYCVGHEAFITEKDLVDGKCADHQQEPEIVEEENWFFKLSKFSDEIKAKIESNELTILPETRKNEILSLIKSGLEDVSFSRPRKDLSWGIPVPNDDSHTMYVWYDALVNYLTGIGYGRDEVNFKKYWPADVHVIGKDILRFHAAIWPAMLLAAGLELPRAVYVHGFLTVNGQKISKTIGNVIDPNEIVEKYGTDAVRYYLLREIPSGEDGDFSYEKFEARYNGDLAHGLGNFASRVSTLGAALGEISRTAFQLTDSRITAAIESARANIEGNINTFLLHEALGEIWKLIGIGDAYLNAAHPWKEKNDAAVITMLILLDHIAALLTPFLPETAEKISSAIQWRDSIVQIKKIENLFPVKSA